MVGAVTDVSDPRRTSPRLSVADNGAVVLGYTIADYFVATVVTIVFSIPLAISVWALLDAARRPAWVWALANRDRVVWMAAIMFSVLATYLGLIIPLYYLWRVRPALSAIERGELG